MEGKEPVQLAADALTEVFAKFLSSEELAREQSVAIAKILEIKGLLAPSPLEVEKGIRWNNGTVQIGRTDPHPWFWHDTDDPQMGIPVQRLVSEWVEPDSD